MCQRPRLKQMHEECKWMNDYQRCPCTTFFSSFILDNCFFHPASNLVPPLGSSSASTHLAVPSSHSRGLSPQVLSRLTAMWGERRGLDLPPLSSTGITPLIEEREFNFAIFHFHSILYACWSTWILCFLVVEQDCWVEGNDWGRVFGCPYLLLKGHLINPVGRRKLIGERNLIALNVNHRLQEILALLHPLSSFVPSGLDKCISLCHIHLGSKNQHKVLSIWKLQLIH